MSIQLKDLIESKLRIYSNNITTQIIQAHMQNQPLNFDTFILEKGFTYGVYDQEQHPIYTEINNKVDFNALSYSENNTIYYLNKSVNGHLNAHYVVIKSGDINLAAEQFIRILVGITLLIYAIIAAIGFYLSKLFILPIQKQREKLNDFIKDTTHELNTPISSLLLCVENDDFFTQKNREYIEISAKKISDIYKDLTYLLFLKENNSVPTDEIELSMFLETEVEFHKKIAAKKEISLISKIDECHKVATSEDFIRLCNNIVSNAVKYTKRMGTIEVYLDEHYFCVKDTGIGIPKEHMNKIFSRYYRATNLVGGFGVGLSIVHSICKKYSYRIEVDSIVGKGTEFKVIF